VDNRLQARADCHALQEAAAAPPGTMDAAQVQALVNTAVAVAVQQHQVALQAANAANAAALQQAIAALPAASPPGALAVAVFVLTPGLGNLGQP
jgi:hypothetical protein